MPERVNPVDPPDLGLLPTLRRLLRLWRAEWRLGIFAIGLAFGYTSISITIPVLIQQAVDHAIVAHSRPLWPYILAIVGLAAVRFLINFSRRYATARIGIRIEARMRELLYHAYLRFPRAFYDRHATGQVLSRATNDLYPIRYFIGWGLVQGIQSLMMIVAAAIVLLIVNPRLALYTAVACRRSRCSRCASRAASRRSPARCRSARATSPRRPTRPSSASRWCRRSGARQRYRTASASGRRPSATPCCARRASRHATSPASTTCPRSRSQLSSSSAAGR